MDGEPHVIYRLLNIGSSQVLHRHVDQRQWSIPFLAYGIDFGNCKLEFGSLTGANS